MNLRRPPLSRPAPHRGKIDPLLLAVLALAAITLGALGFWHFSGRGGETAGKTQLSPPSLPGPNPGFQPPSGPASPTRPADPASADSPPKIVNVVDFFRGEAGPVWRIEREDGSAEYVQLREEDGLPVLELELRDGSRKTGRYLRGARGKHVELAMGNQRVDQAGDFVMLSEIRRFLGSEPKRTPEFLAAISEYEELMGVSGESRSSFDQNTKIRSEQSGPSSDLDKKFRRITELWGEAAGLEDPVRMASLYEQAHQLEEELESASEQLVEAEIGEERLFELDQLSRQGGDAFVTRLLAIIAELPESAYLHYFFGKACLGENQPEAAVFFYRRATEIDPANLYYFYKLGTLELNRGNFAEAAQVFRPIYDRNPQDPLSAINLAKALRYQGELGEAEALIREAIDQEETGFLWDDLGLILLAKGELFDAEVAFRKAIKFDDKWLEPKIHLAVCLFDQGKTEDSDRILSEVSENDMWLHAELAELFHDRGEETRWREHLETAQLGWDWQKFPEGHVVFSRHGSGRADSAASRSSTETASETPTRPPGVAILGVVENDTGLRLQLRWDAGAEEILQLEGTRLKVTVASGETTLCELVTVTEETFVIQSASGAERTIALADIADVASSPAAEGSTPPDKSEIATETAATPDVAASEPEEAVAKGAGPDAPPREMARDREPDSPRNQADSPSPANLPKAGENALKAMFADREFPVPIVIKIDGKEFEAWLLELRDSEIRVSIRNDGPEAEGFMVPHHRIDEIRIDDESEIEAGKSDMPGAFPAGSGAPALPTTEFRLNLNAVFEPTTWFASVAEAQAAVADFENAAPLFLDDPYPDHLRRLNLQALVARKLAAKKQEISNEWEALIDTIREFRKFERSQGFSSELLEILSGLFFVRGELDLAKRAHPKPDFKMPADASELGSQLRLHALVLHQFVSRRFEETVFVSTLYDALFDDGHLPFPLKPQSEAAVLLNRLDVPPTISYLNLAANEILRDLNERTEAIQILVEKGDFLEAAAGHLESVIIAGDQVSFVRQIPAETRRLLFPPLKREAAVRDPGPDQSSVDSHSLSNTWNQILDLLKSERHADALALANDGIAAHPGCIEFYWGKSSALRELKRTDEAAAVRAEIPTIISKQLEDNPDDPILLCSAGSLAASREAITEAEHYFKKSLAIDPNSARTYRFWSRAIKKRGTESVGAAIEKLREGLSIEPNHRGLQTQLYVDLQFHGQFDEADRIARDLIRHYGFSPEIVEFLSRGGFAVRHPEEIKKLLVDFRNAHPESDKLSWFSERAAKLGLGEGSAEPQ